MDAILRRVGLGLCAVLLIGSVACNGSSSKSSSGPSMRGEWNGSFGGGVAFLLDLKQSGDSITGTYSSQGLDGTVTGSVDGTDVAFTVTLAASGAVSQFSGQVDEARTVMAGTFNIVSGGGGRGQWTATK